MSNWVQKDAAELLSISPRVMNYKIKTLGHRVPARPPRRAAPLRAESKRRRRAMFLSWFFVVKADLLFARGCALLVDLEQLRGVDVRVALRRAEARVAEQFLNRAQVGAALQQVRRERMPQRVRADAGPRAARRHVAPHQPVDAPHGQPPAAIVHEQRIARRGVWSGGARDADLRPPEATSLAIRTVVPALAVLQIRADRRRRCCC